MSPPAGRGGRDAHRPVRKLSTYRATLDAGGDPKIVSEWMAQTQAEKRLAEARLSQHGTGSKRLSREQIQYIVTTLTDITQVIHDADPRDKAEIYSQLGLRLTYHPGKQQSWSKHDQDPCAQGLCPRPDLNLDYMITLRSDLLLVP
jgi:hypothetical protein